MHVAALTPKHSVRDDVDLEVEVASLSAVPPGLPFPCDTDPRAVLDTCRNLHFNRAMLGQTADAGAGSAGTATLLAGSTTDLAGDLFGKLDAACDPGQYLTEGQLDSGL
jgi:hypothetical protein